MANMMENTNDQEEKWELPDDFNLFASHEIRKVVYPKDVYESAEEHFFKIECIEPDSPLDILNKDTSALDYDATGHCVWVGAFLLICSIKKLYDKHYEFENKTLIEFGAGTGIAGLSIFLARHRPSEICFTDYDPAALAICERSCRLNDLKEDSYSTRQITWGEEIGSGSRTYDIALATDVLYDVDLICPLFTTVGETLEQNGIFILSHIPRACFNENNPPEAVENLEKYIIDQARIYNFEVDDIIKPPENVPEEMKNWVSNQAFHNGAVIVFRKTL